MLWGLLAIVLFAAAGWFAVSALDHPLKPLPADTDPIYLLTPALFFGFGGTVFAAFAFGISWERISQAISSIMINMFAII